MGRISNATAPTETFSILLQNSDAGAKNRQRLKIALIVLTALGILGGIGALVGLSVFVATKSPFEDLMKNGDNQTLLLIGGQKADDGSGPKPYVFVNEIEVIGIDDCPKLKHLPRTDQDHKTLSTLTRDNYLVICTEYSNVIACHSKQVQEKESIQMPDLINDTFGLEPKRGFAVTIFKFREDFQGITVGNEFILMKKGINEEDNSAEYFTSIYQAETNEFTDFVGGNKGRSDLKLTAAYNKAVGSCFVTLTSKHFLQIGGNDQGVASTNVQLFSYVDRQLFEHNHFRGRGRIVNQEHQVSEWKFKLIQ